MLLWITGLVDIYAIVNFLALKMNHTHLQRLLALDVVSHPVYHFHQINQSTNRPLYQEGDTITIEISALIED